MGLGVEALVALSYVLRLCYIPSSSDPIWCRILTVDAWYLDSILQLHSFPRDP